MLSPPMLHGTPHHRSVCCRLPKRSALGCSTLRLSRLKRWCSSFLQTCQRSERAQWRQRQRIEAVLTRLLPGRRNFWAERCAWTAAVLKESAEDDETWIDFALVARDLA